MEIGVLSDKLTAVVEKCKPVMDSLAKYFEHDYLEVAEVNTAHILVNS